MFFDGLGVSVGDICRGDGRKVLGYSLGLIAVSRQYGVALQHAKYSIKYAGVKDYEKTIMQIAILRKNKAAIWVHSNRHTNPSQLGGPSTKGP